MTNRVHALIGMFAQAFPPQFYLHICPGFSHCFYLQLLSLKNGRGKMVKLRCWPFGPSHFSFFQAWQQANRASYAIRQHTKKWWGLGGKSLGKHAYRSHVLCSLLKSLDSFVSPWTTHFPGSLRKRWNLGPMSYQTFVPESWLTLIELVTDSCYPHRNVNI